MPHRYYKETSDGSRVPINEWTYMALTQVENWVHVLRLEAQTVIKEVTCYVK